VAKAAYVADNLDEGIPRLLTGAGLECTEVASHRHVMGRITYYRALRPA
jgi:hypothetical protein